MAIKSIIKATDILLALSCSPNRSMTLERISEVTELNKSTCVHILKTLCEVGFVMQASGRGSYQLGPNAYYLTRYGCFEEEFVKVCNPILKSIYDKIGETVLLSVIECHAKFIIHYFEGGEKIYGDIQNKKSKIILDDIYSTATGRVMLANMYKQEVEEIYQIYGCPTTKQWPGVNSFEDLLKELKKIKHNGYSYVQRQPPISHKVGYACAITLSTKVLGAIGIAVPKGKYSGQDEMELIKLLKKGAQKAQIKISKIHTTN